MKEPNFRGMVVFFALACLFSWPVFFVVDAWLVPGYLDDSNDPAAAVAQVFGHMLGMLGPALAAMLMWCRDHGRRPPRLRWSQLRFYAVSALAMLALFLAPAGLGLAFDDALGFRSGIEPYRWTILVSGFTLLWVAGMGEEIGWIAYLLPRLAPRLGKTGALLVAGAIRGTWHWPVLIGPVIHDVVAGDGSVVRLVLLSVAYAIQLAISNAITFGAVFGWLWFKTESVPLLGWTHQWFDQSRAIVLITVAGLSGSLWLGAATLLLAPLGYVALIAVAREEGITLTKWGWPVRNRDIADTHE